MKKNEYTLELSQLRDKNGVDTRRALSVNFKNHDDIFEIIEKIKSKKILADNDAITFAIGIKLLSEVALEHRKDEFIKEFFPHLKDFMFKIKSI